MAEHLDYDKELKELRSLSEKEQAKIVIMALIVRHAYAPLNNPDNPETQIEGKILQQAPRLSIRAFGISHDNQRPSHSEMIYIRLCKNFLLALDDMFPDE